MKSEVNLWRVRADLMQAKANIFGENNIRSSSSLGFFSGESGGIFLWLCGDKVFRQDIFLDGRD